MTCCVLSIRLVTSLKTQLPRDTHESHPKGRDALARSPKSPLAPADNSDKLTYPIAFTAQRPFPSPEPATSGCSMCFGGERLRRNDPKHPA